MFNNQIIAGSSGAAGQGGGSFYSYSIDQSLRLDGTSAYLTKSNFGTATDTAKRTFSTWVKRGVTEGVAGYNHIIGAGSSAIDGFGFQSGTAKLEWIQGGTVTKVGVRDLRDTSAWYHFFTTWNATDNELFIYVNGELDYSDTGSLSALSKLGNTGHTTYIGKRSNAAQYIHGYLAETVFLDGYIGDVNDFGELVNGVWVPKNISAAGLTYGTNGFYLDYADSSDLGKDVSGQGNHFTSNGLAAEDQVPDSPTNNFATLNYLPNSSSFRANLSNGNLYNNPGNDCTGFGTISLTTGKKWYMEGIATNAHNTTMGIFEVNDANAIQNSLNTIYYNNTSYKSAFYHRDGTKYIDGVNSSYGAAFTTGDLIGMAVDLESATNTITFYKNNVSQGSFNLGANGLDYLFCMSRGSSGGGWHMNFGQDDTFANSKTSGSAEAQDANGIGDFYYTPPAGHLALCTANLPEPTISPNAEEQADDYFNTVIWSGNSTSDRDIVTNHATDLVWIKSRSNATNHYWFDSIRGVNNQLLSNGTSAEAVISSNRMTAFNSDGFQVGNFDETNGSGKTFVGWSWKAGGAASSIAVDAYSAGVPSIASNVSAAPDAGFSIVSWTGTGANSTIAHGLGEAPKLIIVKNRDDTSNWPVYSEFIGAANRLYFDLGNGSGAASTLWNSTAATNQVFSVGTSNLSNGNTDEMIAYCFHSSDICKVGKYVGNGFADGTFVYTGFRPAWVMVKRSNSTGSWLIFDSERSAYNLMSDYLLADTPDTEVGSSGTADIDFLSNGFKLRSNPNGFNGSGDTHIYLAFAEAPAKYSNAR